jgi:low affinity Fe/Cu permease
MDPHRKERHPPGLRDRFHRFAARASDVLGWQLVINTATTIVTFLMVFLIQNTQNRDAKALHLKLDELVRANQRARDSLINLETMSEGELRQLELEFQRLRSAHRHVHHPERAGDV